MICINQIQGMVFFFFSFKEQEPFTLTFPMIN